MAKRELPEVNAGSMADIAFLLLIFFLVTTTMEVDTGIYRKLPPMDNEDTPPPKLKERNLLVVLINKFDQLQVNGELTEVKNLKEKTREFIVNESNAANMPEEKIVNIDGYGEVRQTKGVISLQNDRGTTYSQYIAVQDALASAFSDLRDEAAKKKWNKTFEELDKDQKEIIRQVVPMPISEAEPKNVK